MRPVTPRNVDFRGARGSNTGDDFHELWAMRQAIRLLSNEDGLQAICLEGLAAKDESGAPADTWDGVDCALYFGSEDSEEPQRVELVQLKYSAANPRVPWTVARLIRGGRSNSVIHRMAEAWKGLTETGAASTRVVLISNQPISSELRVALRQATGSPPPVPARMPSANAPPQVRLAYSSGLEERQFPAFAAALDLSGKSGSRFALEEDVLRAIAAWTDFGLRQITLGLRDFVRRRMMPESAGEPITRESVLFHFGFTDRLAMFPCPSEIQPVSEPVRRERIRDVIGELRSGTQRYVCLHGEAGVGKTTALQEIEAALPEGSVMVKYDCYGGGDYMDPAALRHGAGDAFTQLTNELATSLQLPLIVDQSEDINHPRMFMQRLGHAARALESQTPDALIVIAIDAADNATTAAEDRIPREVPFTRDFLRLRRLPKNVRFVVTARTGRLDRLELREPYEIVRVPAFNEAETATHLERTWPEVSWAPSEVEDFHSFSRGIPRFQGRALDTSGVRSSAAALQRVRGKTLKNVFADRLAEAHTKAGNRTDVKNLCAGLMALPRPVPLEALAAVLDCTEQQLVDICGDLGSGIRLQESGVGFADEDFEAHVREEAQDVLSSVHARAAEWMLSQRNSSQYAASHVAGALHVARRGADLLALVESEPDPVCISEPVLRRQAKLQRLRLAARVCTEAGDPSRALRFVLMSAEGARSEKALKELLLDNADLAVRFAPKAVRDLILSDPDLLDRRGTFLLRRLVVDADRRDAVSVREGRRQLHAWLQARTSSLRLKKPDTAASWRIDADDIGCDVEAQLKLKGPAAAVRALRSWVPRHLALQTALSLPYRLIAEGRSDLVKGLLESRLLSPAEALFLLTPLALSGEQIDTDLLAQGLDRIGRRKLRIRDFFDRAVRCPEFHAQLLSTVLTACEILTIKGSAPDLVDGLLNRFLAPEIRRIDRRYTSKTTELDLLFRAYALREARAGRTSEVEQIFAQRPKQAGREDPRPSAPGELEHDRDLAGLAHVAFSLYRFVAVSLVLRPPDSDLELRFRKALPSDWRLNHQSGSLDLRWRAAENLLTLLAAGYEPSLIKRLATEVRGQSKHAPSVPAKAFMARLSLFPELHASLLEDIGIAVDDAENLRMAAGEKVDFFVGYARHAAPLSEDESRAIFRRAVDTSAEVDHDIWAQFRLLDELVRHAGASSFAVPRRTAERISDVVADAAIRLRDYRNFAWDHAMSALAHLDPGLALASAARWDEACIANLGETLPEVLMAGLSAGSVSPGQAAALSLMWDGSGRAVAEAIAVAERVKHPSLAHLVEEAAQDNLLRHTSFGRGELVRLIRQVGLDSPWCSELLRRQRAAAGPEEPWRSGCRTLRSDEVPEELRTYQWTAEALTDATALQEAVVSLQSRIQEGNSRLRLSTILDVARSVVRPPDRIPHLEAIASLDLESPGPGASASLLRAIDEWSRSAAVTDWRRTRLPEVVFKRFPELAHSVYSEKRHVEEALSQSDLPPDDSRNLLLRSVEHHVHRFKPQQIFRLVSIISARTDPAEIATLVDWYAARLAQRIPNDDRESPTVREIPVRPDEAIARFLFTYLGDPDVRLRWRAAHAVRRLARLHEVPTLKALVAQYGRHDEPAFREQAAGPFYWLAARLWFAVAWDRVAAETPKVGQVAAEQLLEIARDESFPHLLLRSFAKDACEKLVAAGCLELPHEELSRLRRVGQSGLPTEPEAEGRPSDPLRVSDAGLRFPFDHIDTIPYWYQHLIGAFARVSHAQFLQEADRWIVDVWDHREDADRAAAERQRGRFRYARHGATSHFHGSMPTLESLRRYLEWHAMWRAAGELLKSEPLVAIEEGSIASLYSLEDRLERNKLTAPPLWSADLLCAIPRQSSDELSRKLPVAQWQRATAEAAGPDRLLPDDLVDYLVVDGDEQRRAYDRHQRTRTRSALVEPSTARSLLRALQTIKDPWDYGLPFEGVTDDREFDEEPFRLLAWLSSDESDPRIDEKDPLRGDASAIMCRPGRRVVNACRLRRDQHSLPQWSSHRGDPPMFTFEAWGTPERRHSDDGRDDGASGHRLLAHKGQLQSFLSAEKLDLICKVEVTRSARTDRSYGTERPDDQSPVRRARLYRLACDGSLEVAEGGLGTWREDRSTA